MAAINYLFPPEQVELLPTWRFILHFVVGVPPEASVLVKARAALKSADWKIISFPFGIDAVSYDPVSQSVDVAIEVSEERRKRANSLPDYESDFWKVCGNIMSAGLLGDIYYEAVDWQE
jgi:hypothetical protein